MYTNHFHGKYFNITLIFYFNFSRVGQIFYIQSSDTKLWSWGAPFFHPREHTNPTILMDAKQLSLTLFLFVLFVPCVFDDSLHYVV